MFSLYSSVRCLPNWQLLPCNSPSTRELIFIQSTEYRVMWKRSLTDEPLFSEGLLWSVIVLGVHRLGITLFSPLCALSGLILATSDLLIHVWHGTAALLTSILPMHSDVWHGLIPMMAPWQRGPNRMMPEISELLPQGCYKYAKQVQRCRHTEAWRIWDVFALGSKGAYRGKSEVMFESVSPGLRSLLTKTLIALFVFRMPA